ncbi:hypothetical protein E4P34_08665 [Kocuria rhizophila]|uniref:DUF2231 domain-containing protein n=1 Tax=Kocuria rhizophila TaxID=72000 RepID=A0AAX2SC19_KOCRH|nr:DUF2231 domain-containing protein [Kocuria rhizophila]TFI02508.1 hypothetical protein E4P33_02545 [Kocuria rhizophila]TFI06652.1 hypothetical protein E4P34_08665 [Kocuria rhizophila]
MTTSQHVHTSSTPESFLTPAMRALENARALDPVVRAADVLSSVATVNESVRELLRGKRLGHALHPLLIEVPMGTWLSALALDVLGGPDERRAARLLTGVGVLSAVPSALTGWAEYSGLQQRDRRVTVVHAGANGVATGLQAGSWLARRSGRHGMGRVLAVGAMSAAGLGGYLGGHLSVSRQVGSQDVAYQDGTNGRL